MFAPPARSFQPAQAIQTPSAKTWIAEYRRHDLLGHGPERTDEQRVAGRGYDVTFVALMQSGGH
jgi:hypothetical protein